MVRIKVHARMSTQIGCKRSVQDEERDQAAIREREQAARIPDLPALVEVPVADDQLAIGLRAYAHTGLRDDEAKEKLLEGTPYRIRTCNDHREVINCCDQDEDAEEAIAPRVAVVEEFEEASWVPAHAASPHCKIR
jgi:hypothetical protein